MTLKFLLYLLEISLISKPYQCYYIKSIASRMRSVKMCPYQHQWKESGNTFCPDADDTQNMYHCLETQTGDYVELCIQPISIPKGYYAKWSSNSGIKFIYKEPCPRGYYQPSELWSNDINAVKCMNKSQCSSPGELYSGCPDGGMIDDLQCRCDYENNYVASIYAFNNPLKKICFTPSRQGSSCSKLDVPCRNSGEELVMTYECMPKCRENWHRKPMELECQRLHYSATDISPSKQVLPNTTENVPANTQTKTPTEAVNQNNGDNNKILIVVVTSVGFVICIIFFVSILVIYKKRSATPASKEEANLINKDSNGNNNNQTGITMVKPKIYHIGYVKNQAIGDRSVIIDGHGKDTKTDSEEESEQ